MSSILREGEAALWYLLGSPSNRIEGWVLAALCVLTAILVLGRMERAMNVPRSGPMVAIPMALLGIAVVLSCYILFRRFVVPAVGFPHGYLAMVVTSAAVSSLVVVPVMCIVQRANVAAGLASWSVSLCAAIFVVVIARTGFDVYEAGSNKAKESKERSAEVEQIIDEP